MNKAKFGGGGEKGFCKVGTFFLVGKKVARLCNGPNSNAIVCSYIQKKEKQKRSDVQ